MISEMYIVSNQIRVNSISTRAPMNKKVQTFGILV